MNITIHATERYQERVDDVPYPVAQRRIRKMLPLARFERRGQDGTRHMRAGELRFVVRDGAVLTIESLA